jgi:SAM-dependent methyltransferase
MREIMKRICPACNSFNNHLIFTNHFIVPTKDVFYDSYDVVECECGMIFADGIPSQSEFDNYYQALSKKSSRFSINNFNEPDWYINIHKSSAKWINDHVNVENKKILDTGCFTGDLMRQLILFGAQCYGYDPSAIGIMIAQKKGLNVTKASSFCASEYYGEKFDVITISHVLEHIVDHKAFFSDIDYAINDDSLIYIEVPDLEKFYISNDPSLLVDQRDPMLQFNSEHINFFTRQSLMRMMDKLGYETYEIEQVSYGASILAGLFRRKKSGKGFCLSYLDQCKIVYEELDKKIEKYSQIPVYIWGAGGNTQRSLAHSNLGKLNIKAFIDNNDSLRGATLMGRPIILPSEISKDIPILISSLLYKDEIIAQINSMKIKNEVVNLYEG